MAGTWAPLAGSHRTTIGFHVSYGEKSHRCGGCQVLSEIRVRFSDRSNAVVLGRLHCRKTFATSSGADPVAVGAHEVALGDFGKDCWPRALAVSFGYIKGLVPEVVEIHGLWNKVLSAVLAGLGSLVVIQSSYPHGLQLSGPALTPLFFFRR